MNKTFPVVGMCIFASLLLGFGSDFFFCSDDKRITIPFNAGHKVKAIVTFPVHKKSDQNKSSTGLDDRDSFCCFLKKVQLSDAPSGNPSRSGSTN